MGFMEDMTKTFGVFCSVHSVGATGNVIMCIVRFKQVFVNYTCTEPYTDHVLCICCYSESPKTFLEYKKTAQKQE